MSIFDFPEAQPVERQSLWKQRSDEGTLVLECDACECRVTAVQFARAVGWHGYRFCPYCGARIMNSGAFERQAAELKWPESMADKFERIERALP